MSLYQACPVHAAELAYNGIHAEVSPDAHDAAESEVMDDIAVALETLHPETEKANEVLAESFYELIAELEFMEASGKDKKEKGAAMLSEIMKFRKAQATAYAEHLHG